MNDFFYQGKPKILKFRYTGLSMLPTFKPGEVLYARPDIRTIQPGDVIIYEQGGLRVVHRVIDLEDDGVKTRGDANPCVDEDIISFEQIYGVVEKAGNWDRMRKIKGGRFAAIRAETRWRWGGFIGQLRPVIGAPYRWIKSRRWLTKFWHPTVLKVRLMSSDGEVVKYIVGGKTVAAFDLSSGHFTCRRPYDLIIFPPEHN